MKSKIRRERNRLVAFYVNDEERDFIVNCAIDSDMSISDYCRKSLIKYSSLKNEENRDRPEV